MKIVKYIWADRLCIENLFETSVFPNMEPLREYVRSKLPIFDPPPPLFIAVCLLCTPQQTFILVSYSPVLLKKSYMTFMMNVRLKNRGVKREKRNRRSMFFTQF